MMNLQLNDSHLTRLSSLAQDLHALWNSPAADMRLKQRIFRIVLQEIIADIDQEHEEIVLLLHWGGGRHSELRVQKNSTGQNRYRTAIEACDVIRQMTGRFNDKRIAATLNRSDFERELGTPAMSDAPTLSATNT